MDAPARSLARQAGLGLPIGEIVAPDDLGRLVEMMATAIIEAGGGEIESPSVRELLLTAPLETRARPRLWTCSGGVAEYVFGRETDEFGDIAPMLATAFRDACQRAGAQLREPGEGIRATVIGASEFTVQLSGNTVHISKPEVLPLHNLPVVRPRLPAELEAASVAAAIRQALGRLDLNDGGAKVALALPWTGEPHYRSLHALAAGVAEALPGSVAAGHPLVIACAGDVGRSLGGILEEELGVAADLVSIDGLELLELDYIDIGKIIQPAGVVPVVIKSLAFHR